jgi:hypothetical protein
VLAIGDLRLIGISRRIQKNVTAPSLEAQCRSRRFDDCITRHFNNQIVLPDIHQIAAGLFANLLRFRVSGNPAPLARAVDGDGTSRRHAER